MPTHNDKARHDHAGQYELKYGHFAGETIARAAVTNGGLVYLDGLRGITKSTQFKSLLDDFLDYEPIARDLDAILG